MGRAGRGAGSRDDGEPQELPAALGGWEIRSPTFNPSLQDGNGREKGMRINEKIFSLSPQTQNMMENKGNVKIPQRN